MWLVPGGAAATAAFGFAISSWRKAPWKMGSQCASIQAIQLGNPKSWEFEEDFHGEVDTASLDNGTLDLNGAAAGQRHPVTRKNHD